ncbi:MAG: efflux RND transporter periplasmic adaptor subunit [Gammaproteobacteria bacterium]
MKRLQLLTLLGLIGAAAAAGLNPLQISYAADEHDHAGPKLGSIGRAAARAQDAHAHDEHAHDEHAHDEHAHDEHAHDEHAHDEHAHDEHAHDEHAHDEHAHAEGAIRLQPEVMREFGIEVRIAAPGTMARTLRLPGEVTFNGDRIAHVRPTVSGSVKQVLVSVGDRVAIGQTMALLNSRELAAMRSEFLTATARYELAHLNRERDQRLFREKILTERAALNTQQAYREADIERNQAENALHALGYSDEQVAQLSKLDDTAFNTYEILSPLSGIVTQRHLTIGEVVGPDDDEAPFVVADLSTVWVNLTVYQRHLAQVRPGQSVTILFDGDIPDAHGRISFVSPSIDEVTRTATARILIENPHGDWRPGLFVSALVETGEMSAAVVVPNAALTELDGRTVVFVQTEEGFEPRTVRLGHATSQSVEILEGLAEGESYAADNVLALKAESNRAALEHAGHVH